MSKAALLPFRQLLSQADVFRLLGEQIARDCIEVGWLSPRVAKPHGRGRKLIFALSDVTECEQRILNGEYPK